MPPNIMVFVWCCIKQNRKVTQLQVYASCCMKMFQGGIWCSSSTSLIRVNWSLLILLACFVYKITTKFFLSEMNINLPHLHKSKVVQMTVPVLQVIGQSPLFFPFHLLPLLQKNKHLTCMRTRKDNNLP